jgi:PTS system ascorbate-specific IIA component
MDLLLIVAHKPLASALQAVAAHAFRELSAMVQAVDVEDGEPPDETQTRVAAALSVVPRGEALILTDVFGASPCNAALRVAERAGARVVAGVNVPMIWRALCYRSEPLDLLVQRVVDGATQGVLQVAQSRPQNQAQRPGEDDQERHNDQ